MLITPYIDHETQTVVVPPSEHHRHLTAEQARELAMTFSLLASDLETRNPQDRKETN